MNFKTNYNCFKVYKILIYVNKLNVKKFLEVYLFPKVLSSKAVKMIYENQGTKNQIIIKISKFKSKLFQ